MPEFTGDYKSAGISVKNNIMKGLARFIKKMNRVVRIAQWRIANRRELLPGFAS
jgi:hypothetical protein